MGIMGSRAIKEEVKVDHFLLGKVTVKNEFNKELITCHKPMLRIDEFVDWEEKYKVAVTTNKQSLLLPESYDKMKIQKFLMCCECPADTEMAITFERFDFTLQKQIALRKQKQSYFTEPELFYFFYKLLEGCKQFQLRKIRVGDIRSCNVVKTKQNELKLITVASYPQIYTPIERILDYLDTKTTFLLAPEEIDFLKKRGYTNSSMPNPATEAFALGLTILECATLTPSQSLYEKPPSRQIKEDELEFRIKSIEDRYPFLVRYLRRICAWDFKQRLSTGEMWACLKPYSSNICQVTPFSPKQSAEKTELAMFKNNLEKRSYN